MLLAAVTVVDGDAGAGKDGDAGGEEDGDAGGGEDGDAGRGVEGPASDLQYGIDDTPPWYLCILLGFQVSTLVRVHNYGVRQLR